MFLAFGYHPHPTCIKMDNTKKYFPEQLKQIAQKYKKLPAWLRFDSKLVEINSDDQLDLACRVVCEYHQLLRDPQEVFAMDLDDE